MGSSTYLPSQIWSSLLFVLRDCWTWRRKVSCPKSHSKQQNQTVSFPLYHTHSSNGDSICHATTHLINPCYLHSSPQCDSTLQIQINFPEALWSYRKTELGHVNTSGVSSLREVMVTLLSVLLRAHLGIVSIWGLHISEVWRKNDTHYTQKDKSSMMRRLRTTPYFMFNWFLTRLPKQFSGERIIFQQMVLEQCGISTYKRIKSDPYLMPYIKTQNGTKT